MLAAFIASFLFKQSSEFEESHAMSKRPGVVSDDGALVGSCVFIGWFQNSLLLSPGWCFLSGPLRGGSGIKESSHKQGSLSV